MRMVNMTRPECVLAMATARPPPPIVWFSGLLGTLPDHQKQPISLNPSSRQATNFGRTH